MRGLKKFIYGAFYLAVLAALVFWLMPTAPAECDSADCLTATPQPSRVLLAEPEIFFAQGAVSAFVEAKNSGASAEFSYRINFYDIYDVLVGSLEKRAQFPASSARLLSGIWPAPAARAEFELLDGRELPAVIFPPSPQVSETLEISGDSGRLRGELRNVSAASLREISIAAAFLDSAGQVWWVGDTAVSGLEPYGSAGFLIVLPKDPDLLEKISSGSREFFIYSTQ